MIDRSKSISCLSPTISNALKIHLNYIKCASNFHVLSEPIQTWGTTVERKQVCLNTLHYFRLSLFSSSNQLLQKSTKITTDFVGTRDLGKPLAGQYLQIALEGGDDAVDSRLDCIYFQTLCANLWFVFLFFLVVCSMVTLSSWLVHQDIGYSETNHFPLDDAKRRNKKHLSLGCRKIRYWEVPKPIYLLLFWLAEWK